MSMSGQSKSNVQIYERGMYRLQTAPVALHHQLRRYHRPDKQSNQTEKKEKKALLDVFLISFIFLCSPPLGLLSPSLWARHEWHNKSPWGVTGFWKPPPCRTWWHCSWFPGQPLRPGARAPLAPFSQSKRAPHPATSAGLCERHETTRKNKDGS